MLQRNINTVQSRKLPILPIGEVSFGAGSFLAPGNLHTVNSECLKKKNKRKRKLSGIH